MNFLRDLQHALRSLSRVPALWITVALTLALGIGANAAIFSVVRAVLLKPLANQDESRLLYIRQSAQGLGTDNANWSVPEIHDINSGLKSIGEIGTFSETNFTIVGLGAPRTVTAGVVDGNYFQVMGLRPVLGRLLGPGDDGRNAPGAIVLTYNFWRDSLHGDPNVLGKVVRIEVYQGPTSGVVVGVLEPSVPYPSATEIFANLVTSPHHLSATMVTGRSHRMTEVFGRLAPSATLEQARSELSTVYSAMTKAHTEQYHPTDHYQIGVTRMHDQLNEKANTILWILFAASALLFVIASSNVANLVLARSVRRENELATRAALGATTGALRRTLLAESLVLCGSGAIAAVALAIPMVKELARYAARFTPRASEIHLDFTLVLAGVALAVLAAVFLAFVPRLPSPDAVQGGLAGRGTRVTGGSSARLRVFAITQIAASFLLLVGAAVLMRTLFVLEQTRPPFDTSHVMAIDLPVMAFGRTPEQITEFRREVVRNVAAIPGVEHAAEGASVPWRADQGKGVALQFAASGARRPDGQDYRAKFRPIGPGFFETLGVPILAGRDFNPGDKQGAEQVVIISKSLADFLYPGQNALNRAIHWTDPVIKFVGIGDGPRRIVAVVPDFDDENIIPQPAMTIYQPTEQEGFPGSLFVRAKQDPYTLLPEITRRIRAMSNDQPVEKPTTLGDVRAEVLSPDKLNAIVFGGFAAVALLISVVGVAGVLSFSVSSRTREFGIRMALGAQPATILAGVLRDGLWMAGIGVAAGIVMGFVLARVVASRVTAIDQPGVLAFAGAAGVILAAAVVASAIPAMRAARVNAAEALRAE
ncbi:ADOP family duplicated permease [Terracidiphilus sp.]|jgi:predicted permease|uniref:ADOP family duplicated permease n=1 Tax=Terracidiphilus sp. TaxID=1964191 RepID=UPI003C1659D1